MKYSVGLLPPFAFSSYWYLIGAGLIILAFVLTSSIPRLIGSRYFSGLGFRIRSPFRLNRYRRDILEDIDKIERSYKNSEIDSRGVFQRMSMLLRAYVQSITGWRTRSMVCGELMNLPAPKLGEYINEYYKSEFEFNSVGNPEAAVRKGREVVFAMHEFAIMYYRVIRKYEFRMRISRKLYGLLRIAPRWLEKMIIKSLRRKALRQIAGMEARFKAVKPNLYILFTQARLEVQNFILAVTGCEDPATIPIQLRRKNKPGPAALAKKFFSREYAADSTRVRDTVLTGKELIEKWE